MAVMLSIALLTHSQRSEVFILFAPNFQSCAVSSHLYPKHLFYTVNSMFTQCLCLW